MPVSQKLHDLLALTSQLRPSGASLGVLFKPPEFLSLEREVYLAKSVPRSSFDEITLIRKFDNFLVLGESLPPDTDDHVVEGACPLVGPECHSGDTSLTHTAMPPWDRPWPRGVRKRSSPSPARGANWPGRN